MTLGNSANDQKYERKTILKALLLEGSEPVDVGSHEDEVWYGTAILSEVAPGGAGIEVPIFTKMAPPERIVSELVCAWLGRLLGLPVPEPILMNVRREALPDSKFWGDRSGCLTFASMAIGDSDNFKQLLRKDSQHARRLIATWKQFPHAATFDELIANTDRNAGNLLFEANVGQIWMIDHAQALGGMEAKLFGRHTVIDTPFDNFFLGAGFVSALSTKNKNQILRIAEGVLGVAKGIDYSELLNASGCLRFISHDDEQTLLTFLTERIAHTIPLLCQRLGMPSQRPLVLASPH